MQGFVNIYCKKMYLYAETGTTVEASSNTWMAWRCKRPRVVKYL